MAKKEPAAQGDTAPAGKQPDSKTPPPDETSLLEGAPPAESKAGDKPADKDGQPPPPPEGKAGAKPPVEGQQAPPEKTGPPEKYELVIPQDATRWIDAEDIEGVEALARARGWSNEDAQAELEDHVAIVRAQSAAFRAETVADTVYGGAHLAETQRLARLALDGVRPAGTPRGDAIRRILGKTGYGNNLEVLSMLADFGKLMAEDHPLGGSPRGAAAKEQTLEEMLYPTTSGKT
jgi:hypothetical protein